MHHFQELKNFLRKIDRNGIAIKTQGRPFTVKPVFLVDHLIGVDVSNLGNSPFLPIEAFAVVISLLSLCHDKKADKGKAMNFKLGDEGLRIDSIEGHIASVIYGKTNGESVFRRITPISRILELAGVCENGRGYLKLKS